MTFPRPYIPPVGLTNVTLVARVEAKYPATGNNYPSGIQAGDLIIGRATSYQATTFRAACGLTKMLEVKTSPNYVYIGFKIADGTEGGTLCQMVSNYLLGEVVEVFRFNKPLTGAIDPGISAGSSRRSTSLPPLVTCLTGSYGGTPPLMAFCAYLSGDFSGTSLTYPAGGILFGGSGGGSTAYTHQYFWTAGETPFDIVNTGFTGSGGDMARSISVGALELY